MPVCNVKGISHRDEPTGNYYQLCSCMQLTIFQLTVLVIQAVISCENGYIPKLLITKMLNVKFLLLTCSLGGQDFWCFQLA